MKKRTADGISIDGLIDDEIDREKVDSTILEFLTRKIDSLKIYTLPPFGDVVLISEYLEGDYYDIVRSSVYGDILIRASSRNTNSFTNPKILVVGLSNAKTIEVAN